jgi:hypothetical protein
MKLDMYIGAIQGYPVICNMGVKKRLKSLLEKTENLGKLNLKKGKWCNCSQREGEDLVRIVSEQMEGAKSSSMSPYQVYDFRARPDSGWKGARPKAMGICIWLSTNQRGRIDQDSSSDPYRDLPARVHFAAPILDNGGVLLLPSADCDPIREQLGGFVSTPHSSRSLRSTPEILQFLKGLQVTKENLRTRTTSAPPTFQSALSRPLPLCSLMRFGHDRGHRG